MREIKFRAWDTKVQEFLYPASVNGFTLTALQSSRYVLMQYTGLKDMNGKEIFEGDILYRNFVVEWQDNACRFNIDKTQTHEVVGNIYENPELLGIK